MALRSLAKGTGGSIGDRFVTGWPLYMAGPSPSVWYVNSETGSDSYSGKQRNRPFATLSAALSAAANGDLIDVMGGHEETLTSTLTISKTVIIAGEGDDDNLARPKFTNAVTSNGSLFSVTGNRAQLRNLHFPIATIANTGTRVACTGVRVALIDCVFKCGQYDNGNAVGITNASSRFYMEGCTFTSTSASGATAPSRAIYVDLSSADITDFWLREITVDGGTVGWNQQYAVEVNYTNTLAPNVFRVERLNLLNGSDAKLPLTGVDYSAQDIMGYAHVYSSAVTDGLAGS